MFYIYNLMSLGRHDWATELKLNWNICEIIITINVTDIYHLQKFLCFPVWVGFFFFLMHLLYDLTILLLCIYQEK